LLLGRLKSGGSRPALENSLEDPISKTRAKQIKDFVQVVECLLCNHETLSSNPSPSKKIEKKIRKP
jgi:hypothetical protein